MEGFELHRGSYKNLTLRVTGDGGLRVTAPWFVPRLFIEAFVRGKADWIEKRRAQLPVPAAEPLIPETVLLWGVRKPLLVEEAPRAAVIEAEDAVVLRFVPGTASERIASRLRDWEKRRVAEALDSLVPRWALRMDLKPERWTVKWLRSRWGSCRPDRRTLVFNAELGRLPPECLEHVVVHELVHLLEPSHNARFHALMEHWLPGQASVRLLLRRGVSSAGPGASPTPPAMPEAGTAP